MEQFILYYTVLLFWLYNRYFTHV